ncbi:glutaredoxin domain-containing protein [Nannocystis pusilla]|uniref:Glutaredoxin n=1 Tax=Nannocystis pusilla TaxID=889268 RepID=A0ABS7THG3_9BACT|nr:glutaredoxin domain-containing protein [Nannocystis pusilla]MBZ5707658.1 glutaredoxin [Nannocystis pusilla]
MTEFHTPEQLGADVVLYVTETCGYCRMAESLLRRRGIAFVAVDVTDLPEARSWLIEKTGRRTVPQIFVKAASIGGFTELAAMDRSGALATALAG